MGNEGRNRPLPSQELTSGKAGVPPPSDKADAVPTLCGAGTVSRLTVLPRQLDFHSPAQTTSLFHFTSIIQPHGRTRDP